MDEVKHRGVYGVDVTQEVQWIVYQLEGRWNNSPATAVGSTTGMCNCYTSCPSRKKTCMNICVTGWMTFMEKPHKHQATFLKVIWYA